MASLNNRKIPWVRVALIIVVAAGIAGILSLPLVREKVQLWLVGMAHGAPAADQSKKDEIEYFEKDGMQSLRLPQLAMEGLDIRPQKAVLSTQGRALPPQIGTLNYDNDRLFTIRSRFPGELAEVTQVLNKDGPVTPTRVRPIRFGDKFKQGDLLAVIWSQQLGAAKAALVDAISALRLSKDSLERAKDLYQKGSINLAGLKAAERQFESDSNVLNTAERVLRMSKLTDAEIQEIKDEAKNIQDAKKMRSIEEEARKWARVEIRVPWFDKENPNRELVLVEKNTNINDMVDPIASPPLFKLADTSRLQIWAHPPEEYLAIIQEGLKKNGPGGVQWAIRFQSEAASAPVRKLDIVQIAPSLEPNQHTPMVLGYIQNPDNLFLIGQFITATIFTPPDENTVEIPTEALNEVEGQSMVFVQHDPEKPEFTLRRVAVVRRFKDVTYVRSKLTEKDEQITKAEVQRGRRPLQPLLPDERVITKGVVELTAALEDLATKNMIAKQKAEGK